jgi:hypothetical protein
LLRLTCGIYFRNLFITKWVTLYNTSNERRELTQNDRIGEKEETRKTKREMEWEEQNQWHDLS